MLFMSESGLTRRKLASTSDVADGGWFQSRRLQADRQDVALTPEQLRVIDKSFGSIKVTLLAPELDITFRYAASLFDEGADLK